MYLLKSPKNHTPSPKFPEISRRAQWNRPLNLKKKTTTESRKKLLMMKFPKKLQNKRIYREKPPKTPESSQITQLQEEPIDTQKYTSAKYNLRPNPNPYYSVPKETQKKSLFFSPLF